MAQIFYSSGKIFSIPISGSSGVWNWFPSPDPPLDVACPVCKAVTGIKCKFTIRYPKPWSKKGRKKKFWEHTTESLPHKERVRDSRIKQVEDKLDGVFGGFV